MWELPHWKSQTLSGLSQSLQSPLMLSGKLTLHNLDLVAGLAVGGGAWEGDVYVWGGMRLKLGKRLELDLELRLGIGSTFSRTTPLMFPSTTSGRPQLFLYVRVRVRVRVTSRRRDRIRRIPFCVCFDQIRVHHGPSMMYGKVFMHVAMATSHESANVAFIRGRNRLQALA